MPILNGLFVGNLTNESLSDCEICTARIQVGKAP